MTVRCHRRRVNWRDEQFVTRFVATALGAAALAVQVVFSGLAVAL